MKILKHALAAGLVFCAGASAFMNENGVIPGLFQVEANFDYVSYRNAYSDGDHASLGKDASQMNLMPTVRFRPLDGLEFSFGYPVRNDDDFKNATGFWGPILGIKYGSPSSAGFFDLVFPSGSKKLLGNGDNPQPVLVFGFTDVFGGRSSFDVRLHSWYWLDLNENSADKMLFLIRPEFSTGAVRIGIGLPIEFYFGSDSHGWIDNAPGHVRAQGLTADDDDLGYAGDISIEPKVLIKLGKLELEPGFSVPIAKFSNKEAVLYYGYTISMAARVNLF
jgi:hypothetical protein